MIDAAALRRHRIDRGLSQRQLAAAIGVDPLTVKRIEDGADPGDLPLRVLQRLTTTLGASPAQLLAAATDPTDDYDLAEAIGATLLATGRTTLDDLARGLSVSCAAVVAAVEALGPRLHAVGMTLARHHDTVWLAPRQPHVTNTAARRPLTIPEARLLRRIQRGENVAGTLSNADRQFTLPALQRRGLLCADGRLRLTASASTSIRGS